MNRQYVIYALLDPETNERRYIGSTANPEKRRLAHRSKTAKRTPLMSAWMEALRNKGLEPVFEIIHSCSSDEDAGDMERAEIAKDPSRLFNISLRKTRVPKRSGRKVRSLPGSPSASCRRCNGTGCVPLPELLTETLSRLSTGKTHTAVASILSITENAARNRLEELRVYGFVRRQRRGKFWVYSATPSPPKRDAAPARRSLR